MWIRRATYFAIVFCSAGDFALASNVPDSKTIALSERVVIASQLYSAVQMYFGHWKRVPDLDLDKEYAHYVQQIIATDDRRELDLASIEFPARLRNIADSGIGG